MWCWDEATHRVQIKLIDWDAGMLMDWHECPPEMARILSSNNRYRLASVYGYGERLVNGLSSSLDTCFIRLLEEHQCNEGLWCTDKQKLDHVFRQVVMEKLDL